MCIPAYEAINGGCLLVQISELRSFDCRGKDGKLTPCAEFLGPVRSKMVEWHGVTERQIAAQRGRETLEAQLIAAKGEAKGRALLAKVDALA